jgi:hippurate hydrolase
MAGGWVLRSTGATGAGDGGHRDQGHGPGPCRLHNPSYDFNDELLPLGMAYWAGLSRRFLAEAR